MAYIYGDRDSRTLFPPSVEEYVSEADPVKVYDAFVISPDLKELGLVVKEDAVAAPVYDPRAMLKLQVFGYSYGFRSSRKLERACRHNIAFMWFMGCLTPGYKAITEFRRTNKSALKNVLKQCARLCIELGLIEGNVLFLDSSKMLVNASRDQSWTQEKCKKSLTNLDARIEELLRSCGEIDDLEKDSPSLVKHKEEFVGKEKLRKKIKSVLEELKETGVKSLISTDRDCVNTKGRQGSHASYTAQVVTDKKNGLIVNTEAISQSNDINQFSRQIEAAENVTGKQAEIACADSGYSQVDDLSRIRNRETNSNSNTDTKTQVVVPNKKQASKKKPKTFTKEDFLYDEDRDEYICPAGKRLSFSRIVEKDRSREYRIKPYNLCQKCEHFGVCTKSPKGRRVARLFNEKMKEELAELYESEEGQKIYALRKQKSELPFGFIKRNLGAGHFLLRGRDGVNGELGLLATSFNISRMINLACIPALLAALGGT